MAASIATEAGLLRECENGSPKCAAYIWGVIDTTLDQEAYRGEQRSICLPDDVTDDEVVDHWLANIRADRTPQLQAKTLPPGRIIYVIRQRFPCPEHATIPRSDEAEKHN